MIATKARIAVAAGVFAILIIAVWLTNTGVMEREPTVPPPTLYIPDDANDIAVYQDDGGEGVGVEFLLSGDATEAYIAKMADHLAAMGYRRLSNSLINPESPSSLWEIVTDASHANRVREMRQYQCQWMNDDRVIRLSIHIEVESSGRSYFDKSKWASVYVVEIVLAESPDYQDLVHDYLTHEARSMGPANGTDHQTGQVQISDSHANDDEPNEARNAP